jgi:hypothetical protein
MVSETVDHSEQKLGKRLVVARVVSWAGTKVVWRVF